MQHELSQIELQRGSKQAAKLTNGPSKILLHKANWPCERRGVAEKGSRQVVLYCSL